MRRWRCVTCGTKIKTIEHLYDECAAKTNSFDRIESRLAVIAGSASEAIELIEKLKGKENEQT